MMEDGLVHADPIRDKYKLAYIFLLIHGIGLLLPWNVFINAREYFIDYKLNTTTSYDADYRINFMSYIGFAAHFPGVCFSAWNTFSQSRTRSSNTVCRFVVAMTVEVFVLLFTIILSIVDTSHIPGTFFALTIASVALINCCVGIHQTLTFGMAAVLPMKYSNAVIVGSNACGTIISTVNIITKWLASVEGRTPHSIVFGAIAYFLSAFTIVIACIVTFFGLRRLPFVRHYINLSKQCLIVPSSEVTEQSTVTLDRPCPSLTETEPHCRLVVPAPSCGASDPAELVSLLGAEHESSFRQPRASRTCCPMLCPKSTKPARDNCTAYCSRYSACLSECWPQCLNIWSVFFCSLSMFPAVQSMVKPSNPNYFISPLWFTDVTCFLFFNLFAMLGCILCNWVKFPGPRYLWIPVWVRTVFFIPFFLFCQFDLAEPKLPVLIANDHVYVLGVIVFAFTNGYLSSLGMMYAPRYSPPERQELAGMLAALFLILGVCSGVYASRGFVSLIL